MTSHGSDGISRLVAHGQGTADNDHSANIRLANLLLEDLADVDARADGDVRLDVAPGVLLVANGQHVLDGVDEAAVADAPVELGGAHGPVQAKGLVEGGQHGGDADTTGEAEDVGVLGGRGELALGALEERLALVAVGALDEDGDAGGVTALGGQELGEAAVGADEEGDAALAVGGRDGARLGAELVLLALLADGELGAGGRGAGLVRVGVGAGCGRVAGSVGAVVADDGERVVLPDSPRERREVCVAVTVAVDAGDVDADVLVVDAGDVGALDTAAASTEPSHQAVEEPDADGGVDKDIVTGRAVEDEADVVPDTDHGGNGEEDVGHEEDLIPPLAEGEDRGGEEEAEGEGRDDTVVPVRLPHGLEGGAVVILHLQPHGRVKTSLEDADDGDPAVSQQVTRMGPVGDPEQHAVAATIQEDEGHVGQREVAGAVGNVARQLGGALGEEGVGRVARVAMVVGDDVDDDGVENVDGLAAGRDHGEAQDGHAVSLAEHGGVNEIGVEGADPFRGPGEGADEGEAGGDADSGEEDEEPG